MTQRPVFTLGQLAATPGALEFLEANQVHHGNLLDRHLGGDWGDLDVYDAGSNEYAVANGLRVFSVYKVGTGKVWIITEADRSYTTILLPDEY